MLVPHGNLEANLGETMAKILMTVAAAALAVGLGGCVGTAGISTWEYQSGPGYEIERIDESRIRADTSRGLTRDACTSLTSRHFGASGTISGDDLTTCRSN
jgi:hypothetical protein